MKEEEINPMVEIQRDIIASAHAFAIMTSPRDFQVFLGSLLGNMTGPLPDEYWEELMKTSPCSEPGCTCHLVAEQTMRLLDGVRRDWKACVGGGRPI